MASPETAARLEAYTNWLEELGHEVHLPHRDTNQQGTELEACMENGAAMHAADEIHIWYVPESRGSHFDLGFVFACDMFYQNRKRVRVLPFSSYKLDNRNFVEMMNQWIHEQNQIANLYPKQDESIDLDFTLPFEQF